MIIETIFDWVVPLKNAALFTLSMFPILGYCACSYSSYNKLRTRSFHFRRSMIWNIFPFIGHYFNLKRLDICLIILLSYKIASSWWHSKLIEAEWRICVSKLTIIISDNGLSPGRRQAIIWTNGGILLIQTLGANFSEILSELHIFSFKKMHLKMSSAR